MQDKNLTLFLALLICCLGRLHAQYVAPDSLKKIINTTKNEQERIEAMNWLSFRYIQNSELDSGRIWIEKAFALSKKVNYKTGLGLGYLNTGNLTYAKGKHLEAIVDYRKAIIEFQKSGHSGYLSVSYLNIALMQMVNENFPESLQNIYKGLSIANKADYEPAIAQAHLMMAGLYSDTEDFNEVYAHVNNAIDLYKKQGEKLFLASAYWTRATAKLGQKKYIEAISDFDTARTTAMHLKSGHWFEPDYFRALGLMYTDQADSLKKLGNIAVADEKFKLGEQYFFNALKKDIAADPYTRALINSNLGMLYLAAERAGIAKLKFEEAISIADRQRDKRLLKDCYFYLARTDSIQENFKSAYVNQTKYLYYNNMLFNEQAIRKRELYKIEFEMEKKNDEIKLLSAENKLKTAIASRRKQQNNFLIAGIGIVLLTGVYFFQRYKKRRKHQSRQALAEERLRISSELHDEVGATLSGISMYSHLTKEQMKLAQTIEVEKSLNIMQQSAGDMVNKLNDIVWLLNPVQDTLQSLIQRLEEYAGEMTAIKNMQLKTSIPQQFTAQSLPIESRRNIYLFCKEAINNAVKYSEASLLELTVKENNGRLEVTIGDDGKGFDANTVKRGNGLNNMQKRADELEACYSINTANGKGVCVSLVLKLLPDKAKNI